MKLNKLIANTKSRTVWKTRVIFFDGRKMLSLAPKEPPKMVAGMINRSIDRSYRRNPELKAMVISLAS